MSDRIYAFALALISMQVNKRLGTNEEIAEKAKASILAFYNIEDLEDNEDAMSMYQIELLNMKDIKREMMQKLLKEWTDKNTEAKRKGEIYHQGL